MAGPGAQTIQGLLNNQNDPTVVKWAAAPLFNDVPTHDGLVRIERARTWLYSISRGGSNLGANVERLDPGFGGGGNATVQAQHTDRNQVSLQAVLSLIEPTSNLHNECSNAPFLVGADIWDYLPSRVYLRIPDDEAQDHIMKVNSWTVKDLPVDKQDEMQCLHFKALILGYNPMRHPNMNITNQTKINVFCNGLHPEAKVISLQMKNNLALAQANGCCFPATWPAGHPNHPAVHPQAGQLSLDALAMYVHREFTMKIRAGLVRLKGQPGVMAVGTIEDDSEPSSMSDMASALPVPSKDAFAYFSINDMRDKNFYDFHEYAINVLNREATRMRTCRNCGGINHFSHKDGVLVCPTAEGSVPVDLLRRIRYPFGVNPWKFTARGAVSKGSRPPPGIGKGRGKGNGKGGGRGRGGYWVYYDHDEPPPTQDEDDQVEEVEEEHAGQYITDDFDGWNQ